METKTMQKKTKNDCLHILYTSSIFLLLILHLIQNSISSWVDFAKKSSIWIIKLSREGVRNRFGRLTDEPTWRHSVCQALLRAGRTTRKTRKRRYHADARPYPFITGKGQSQFELPLGVTTRKVVSP